MKAVLKSTAAVVALVMSFMAIATITSQAEAQAAVKAPKKQAVALNKKVWSVADKAQLTNTQVINARTIVAITVTKKKMPKRAAVIAVATAMQESSLRNLNYGDRDSLGLFQQRPSSGWGTPKQVTDPQYSTRKFLTELQKVPRWKTRPLTQAAQAVQRSAFPNAYARWERVAQKLVDAMLPQTKRKKPAGPKSDAPARPHTAKAAKCRVGRGARRTRRTVSTRP